MFKIEKNVFVSVRRVSTNVNLHPELAQANRRKYIKKRDRYNSDNSQRSYGDADFHETEYYFENGLRKVYPYYFTYSTFCKGRWINKKIVDVYNKEFSLLPKEFYEKRILDGKLKINGQIVSIDYVLKNKDYLTSTVHRHELAVLDSKIQILFEDDELLVINKPHSIPVHPCGLYRHNSILFLLAKEYNLKNLFPMHRIDRLTSGILIFSKTNKKANEIYEQMDSGHMRKEYICMVSGNFPNGIITCDKPLKRVYNHFGISTVDPNGKFALTEFEKLDYDGETSIVRCRPLTGRTHQIRVHLQFLGYPIMNDPLYNSFVFGPMKGKNGEFGKTLKDLLEDLIKEHSSQRWLRNKQETDNLTDKVKEIDESLLLSIPKYTESISTICHLTCETTKDPKKILYDNECPYCQFSYNDPKQTHLIMYLHSYRYQGRNWEFQTQLPKWAANRI